MTRWWTRTSAPRRPASTRTTRSAGPAGRCNRFSPFRVGFAFTSGAGLAYLLYQAIVSARSVLVLVLVAAFLAIGLNPTVSRLERMGLRRGGAVAIVFVGVLAFFAAFGYAVLPPVVTQVANFVEALPGYVRDLQDNPTVDDLDRRFGLVDRLNDYVTGEPRHPGGRQHRRHRAAGGRPRLQGPDHPDPHPLLPVLVQRDQGARRTGWSRARGGPG